MNRPSFSWRDVLLSVVCLSLAGSAAAQPAGEPDGGPVSRDWKRLRTAHYTIVGNASDGDLRQTARELERFRQAIGALSPKMQLNAPVPTLVVVFKDRSSFRPFKPVVNGNRQEGVGGYFIPLRDKNYLALGLDGAPTDSLRLILHEYAHYLTSRNMKRLPRWLNEGLAEFYATFRSDGADGRSLLGATPPNSIHTLQREALIPMRKLVTGDVPLFRDTVRTGVFYAQSWALVHALVLGKDATRRAQLIRYIDELQKNRGPDEAFAASFGDYGALDSFLREYVRQFRFAAISLAPQDAAMALDAPIERLREAEALEIQGGLFRITGQRPDAVRAAERALELDSTRASARVLAGVLQLEGEETARAIDTLNAAAAQAPSDMGAHWSLGDALGAAGRWDEALRAYEKAVALTGNLAELHLSLSLARDAAGDVAGADAAFAHVFRLDPDPAWFQRRAYVLMRRNRGEQAALDAVSYLRDVAWKTEDSPYLAIISIIGFRQGGRQEDASAVLAAATARVDPTSWQATILGFLAGTLTGAELVAKAGDNDKLTEAHAYVGLTASHGGRHEEAIAHLTWVKEKGNRGFYEYPLAVAELARLDKKKPAKQATQ
jgi:tetratricopeptide (TPR) repeat protein